METPINRYAAVGAARMEKRQYYAYTTCKISWHCLNDTRGMVGPRPVGRVLRKWRMFASATQEEKRRDLWGLNVIIGAIV